MEMLQNESCAHIIKTNWAKSETKRYKYHCDTKISVMNLLLVTPWPPKVSGVAGYSAKLFTELKKHMKVTLYKVTLHKSLLTSLLKGLKDAVVLLRTSRSYGIVHVQLEFTYPLTFLIMLPLIVKLMSNIKKVLTVHAIPPLRIRHKDYADSIASALFLRFYSFRLFIMKYLIHLSRSFDSVIVHSNIMKHYLWRCGAMKEKVVVIPHGSVKAGVDIGAFGDNQFNKRERKIVITFLGFLRPSKGIRYLLEALNHLKYSLENIEDIILVKIIGGFSIQSRQNYKLLKSLLRIVKENKLENAVEIDNEYVPQHKLSEIMLQTDIVVLPYVDEFIEVSGVIHDIANYCKPVIVTRIPKFVSELANGKNCLMVEPRNSEELANAIKRLIENDYLRKMLGKNLGMLAERTSWDRVAREHFNIYSGCLT